LHHFIRKEGEEGGRRGEYSNRYWTGSFFFQMNSNNIAGKGEENREGKIGALSNKRGKKRKKVRDEET